MAGETGSSMSTRVPGGPQAPSAQTDEGGHSVLSVVWWDRLAASLQLSERELHVLKGVFDDRTEAAIALELSISAHTVHTHLERLYRKLGISSRCALVVRVFEEYLRLAPTARVDA